MSPTPSPSPRRLLVLLLLGLCLVAGACASDDADDADAAAGPTAVDDGGAAGYEAELVLSGTAEVPGPGSPTGAGAATFTITGDEACLEGEVSDVGEITAGHVHGGGPAESGGVVLDLGVQAEDGVPFSACATIDAELASQIAQTPAAFYVNLHNAEFPDGAVRAQLS